MRSSADPYGQVLGAGGLLERLGVKTRNGGDPGLTQPRLASNSLTVAEDDPELTLPLLQSWVAFATVPGLCGSGTEPRAFCTLSEHFSLSPAPDLLFVCLF